ncbi:MAG: VOC family protein [Flavobacteriaceae bacterium]
MKRAFTLLIIVLTVFNGYSQTTKLPDPEAYFSALIISDIEKSIDWYSNNLGFELINKNESKEMSYKQANLKRGNILIELIELESAVSPEVVIPSYTKKTRLQGFFKVGFLIADFDQWIQELTKLKVEFHGRVAKSNETGKRMVIVKDPDGNRIQLFEK